MTTLLIDGDLWAHRVAAAEETAVDFGGGSFALSADLETGIANLDATLEDFRERLDADRMIVAISDDLNYRKEVMPGYKANRAEVRYPMLRPALLQHLKDAYETFIWPKLEADDVLGILATNPKVVKGEKVIVTMDKDLRTVPGLHWNPMKEGEEGKGPTEIGEREAELGFLAQVLSGDTVDGYSGCPGIGKVRAERLVREPVRLVYSPEEIKRGPNKGTMRDRWLSEPTTDIWECIVSHYEKVGLTEEDALQNARVARILRHGEYDYNKQEPILWTP